MKRGAYAIVAVFAVAAPGLAHADAFALWLQHIQMLTSTLKIATKQESLSKDVEAQARQGATKAAAAAAVDAYNRKAVARAVDQYGPTSQLVDPCYQVGMAGTAGQTVSSAGRSAQLAASRLYSSDDRGMTSVGGVGGLLGQTKRVSAYTYAASVGQRVQRHRDRYCSVSEAATGYCTLVANGMQSGDSDFSMHLAPGKTYGWDQTEAATDFVKTLAPMEPMPGNGSCSEVDCRSALEARREQEAYLSMSRYSMMRFVEAHSTQEVGDARKAGGG